MEKELPKEIKDRFQTDETVLWWGKPDIRIISKNETACFIMGMLIIFWIFIPASDHFNSAKPFFTNLLYALTDTIPMILIFLTCYVLWWLMKKNNTWFVITDQRVLRTDPFNIDMGIQKPLSEIRHFEAMHFKNGGNLYLGRYRFRLFWYRFDYEKSYSDWFNNDEIFHNPLFLSQRKAGDYLFFYSLSDVDTPARIIRERTNAKEYIDPKRKQKNS